MKFMFSFFAVWIVHQAALRPSLRNPVKKGPRAGSKMLETAKWLNEH
jgi:hypothetical protein